MDPTSRVALVTGSGRYRLAWHVAHALAGRAFAVALHYHTAARPAEEAVEGFLARGVPAAAYQADLAREAAVAALVDEVIRRFGRLDVLVHCASLWKARKLEETTADDVTRHFRANVLSTFLCAQQAGLRMAAQPEGGCIVNFGDWAEARPYTDFAAYFATKGAIPALTRCLAVEFGTRNPRVRVNCLLPGPVLFQPDLPESERQAAVRSTLVRRPGRPENIAQAVLALVDNDFITGTCLAVDGGRTVYADGS